MKIPNLKVLVFSFLLLKSITAYPEGYSSGRGGRERAMANASATLTGPFATFNNQAFLSGTTAFQIGIEYAQPWMISNYRVATGAAVFPLPGIVAGLSLSQNAIPGFNETRYGFALAKALGRRFSAGMQFSYFTIGFPESGKTKGTLIYEAGIGFTPNPNVALGLHLFNPFNSHIEGLSLQNDKSQTELGIPSSICGCHKSILVFLNSIPIFCKCFICPTDNTCFISFPPSF